MPPHILVVDDALDWREMLAGLITDLYPTVTVLTAASVVEAREQLAEHPVDLAIVDIRLDESDEENTDGLVLTEYIRANHAQAKVLIITSYANLDTVKQAMHPNHSGLRLAADYIQKDKLNSELLPRIRAILGELETNG